MTFNKKLWLALIAGLSMMASVVFAQDTANDAADVILTIEEQWEAEQSGDDDWIDDLLLEEFSGWPKVSPAPRTKTSIKTWDRFNDKQGRMVEHELYFQNIVVHDDTAVAHYLYSSAFQDNDDEVELSNGRYTDILVRTEDGWKFLSWHGGDND